MVYESKNLYVIKKGHRTAMVRKASSTVSKEFAVSFYYDGYPDYEWKKGSGGIACDLCETLEQAKRKARYYVKKEDLYNGN